MSAFGSKADIAPQWFSYTFEISLQICEGPEICEGPAPNLIGGPS
jgi:hypothetical protein